LFRDEQEKIAEEMVSMTKRLKEQSMVAHTIVKVGTSIVLGINNFEFEILLNFGVLFPFKIFISLPLYY
jgi:hypothetical protein